MLLGFRAHTQQPYSVDHRKGTGENSAPSAPHELVSVALQLSSDQVTGPYSAHRWPTLPAPYLEEGPSPLHPLLRLLFHIVTCESLAGVGSCEDLSREVMAPLTGSQWFVPGVDCTAPECWVFALAVRVLFLVLQVMPAAARSFWEQLPKRRDRELVERLITRVFTPAIIQAEAHAASSQLNSHRDKFPDVEATVMRRARQIVLQLS